MAEHEEFIVTDIHGRQWECLSKFGTDKEFSDVPGATFDACTGGIGDTLNVAIAPNPPNYPGLGNIAFKRIA